MFCWCFNRKWRQKTVIRSRTAIYKSDGNRLISMRWSEGWVLQANKRQSISSHSRYMFDRTETNLFHLLLSVCVNTFSYIVHRIFHQYPTLYMLFQGKEQYFINSLLLPSVSHRSMYVDHQRLVSHSQPCDRNSEAYLTQ